MIRFVKYLARFCGLLCSVFAVQKLTVSMKAALNYFYSGVVARRFYYFGKDSVIAYKLFHVKGTKLISIGDHTEIAKNARLTAWRKDDSNNTPVIKIGSHCTIGACVHITAINGVTIGDHLLTGTNVLITDNSHGFTDKTSLDMPPQEREVVSKGKVKIGNNVWIGNNVCVLPGVTIGDGVVIGANSVVTKDIPNYCVAVGNPAVVVKNSNINS